MQVRVRLGPGLARLATAPLLSLDLDDGATVADACRRVAAAEPALEGPLRAALPVVAGVHADRARALRHGDELALLTPVAGG